MSSSLIGSHHITALWTVQAMLFTIRQLSFKHRNSMELESTCSELRRSQNRRMTNRKPERLILRDNLETFFDRCFHTVNGWKKRLLREYCYYVYWFHLISTFRTFFNFHDFFKIISYNFSIIFYWALWLKILGTRRWDAATGQFVEEDLPPEAMNHHINPYQSNVGTLERRVWCRSRKWCVEPRNHEFWPQMFFLKLSKSMTGMALVSFNLFGSSGWGTSRACLATTDGATYGVRAARRLRAATGHGRDAALATATAAATTAPCASYGGNGTGRET